MHRLAASPIVSILVVALAPACLAESIPPRQPSCAAESCPPTGASGGPEKQHEDEMAWLQTQKRAPLSPEARPAGGRNLVLFYDGSGNDFNKQCSFPSTKVCNTNIVDMMLFSVNDTRTQLTWYSAGVGIREGTSFESGVGVKPIALEGYTWLSENYQPGDKIFIYGFSRGTISARYTQGMMHRVGLAKAGNAEAAIAAHEGGDASSFRRSDSTHPDAKVHFMGLYDGVLRTLFGSAHAYDSIVGYHLELTSTVEVLRHVIALSDIREVFQAHELKTDPSTDAEQVWFSGSHADVGGGWPNKGPPHIALGWMADNAVASGMLLQAGWGDEVHGNFAGDIHNNLDTFSSVSDWINGRGGLLEIRNPARCRNETGKGTIKMHQSVKDRMDLITGWVPMPWCCAGREDAMNQVGIEYVTNDHYQTTKQSLSRAPPQWITLKPGRLANATVSEHWTYGNPEYYLRVQSWHSDVAIDPSQGAGDGCCLQHRIDPPSGNLGDRTGSQDFSGSELVMPYETADANQIVIDVYEDDTTSYTYVGRVVLPHPATPSEQIETYSLVGGPGTLDVQVEYLYDDASAAALLPGEGPAQCKWLFTMDEGQTPDWLCGLRGNSGIFDWIGLSNAETCDIFLDDISTGALLEVPEAS